MPQAIGPVFHATMSYFLGWRLDLLTIALGAGIYLG
jgi:hypothetical protein